MEMIGYLQICDRGASSKKRWEDRNSFSAHVSFKLFLMISEDRF
jgi:hypothetical protein